MTTPLRAILELTGPLKDNPSNNRSFEELCKDILNRVGNELPRFENKSDKKYQIVSKLYADAKNIFAKR